MSAATTMPCHAHGRYCGKPMHDYIAWLNGSSVLRGTLSEVEAEARRVFATPLWQEHTTKPTVMRITRGPKQLFVKSVVLS